MSRHNKKRNTAFIYEALVREVVKQSIKENKDTRNKVIEIIKKHFHQDSALYHDLVFYKTLLETRDTTEKFAVKLLKETLSKRSRLNKARLFKEQSIIISKINKDISKSVFMNYVPSYKHLASLGQLFNDSLKPKAKVLLEEKIVETMISAESQSLPKEKQVDRMVINSFVKRFNNTYGNSLLEEQKELLNKFIAEESSVFKMHIEREISRLKEILEKNKDHEEITKDSLMLSKYNDVLVFLNETHKHPIDEALILKLTQIQQLANEIHLNDKN